MWFLVWNLACGFAQNTGQLLGFRFLAGFGASGPLAVSRLCIFSLCGIYIYIVHLGRRWCSRGYLEPRGTRPGTRYILIGTTTRPGRGTIVWRTHCGEIYLEMGGKIPQYRSRVG
jgi:MFS family permease